MIIKAMKIMIIKRVQNSTL